MLTAADGISYAACDATISTVMATRGERFWGETKTLPPEAAEALKRAEEQLTLRGISYSFCVLNLDSGRMATANTVQRFYSASCVKAPFITGLLQAGYRPTDDMYLAGHNSDNEAYERLLAMGVTHDEVVRRLDGIRRRFQAEHPGREERYLPQCHRLLDEVLVEVEDERAGKKRVRDAREDDALTLARAANLPGPLGAEAFRILDESQRAAARGDSVRSAELGAERRAWCELHRDEVWGHCGRAAAGAAGA